MRIVIATRNPGKIRELREMLGPGRFDWDDLSAHPQLSAPEETGRTFRANACLKAAHYARALATCAIADDSGLEVDALAGRPGVHSARWAELHNAGHGDAANNALLLRQLGDIAEPQRTARFVCVLALADVSGRILITARGTVEGRILDEPRGHNGFGYDPLFFLPNCALTVAQLPSDQKHLISHRGQALRRLRILMDRLLETPKPLIPLRASVPSRLPPSGI